MPKSRREALGLLAAGVASLSGCSGLDNAAEALVDSAETETPTPQHTVQSGVFQSPEPISTATPTPSPTEPIDGGDLLDAVDNTTQSRPTQTTISNGIDQGDLETVSIYDIEHSEEIEAGSYLYWDLDLPSRVGDGIDSFTIEYDAVVRDGPAVDFFLLRQEEFESYSDGENFLYIRNASATDTKYGEIEVTIDEIQPYVFLIDNTNGGDAVPPTSESEADIDLELVVQ